MNEELFSEIAIEAIAPRKNLAFTTSEKNAIYANRVNVDVTTWILKRGSNTRKFTSRNGLDEIETIVIMMTDFFNNEEN